MNSKNKNIPPCMIYIDKEGNWFHRGAEMVHREIIKEFYSNMETDLLGNFIISLGNERCFVEAEDTPFIVTRAVFLNDGYERIAIHLIDGTKEKLDPETLNVGDDNVLYCSVKNNSFRARFNRAAYYQLAEHIREEGDKYYLPLNDQRYYI